VTSMAALTAGMSRSGATADLGLGGPPAARTTGPAGGDRSAVVSSGARTVRSWPLLVLAAPGSGRGVDRVGRHRPEDRVRARLPAARHPPSLRLDTSITLPVGVEAYAAYALRRTRQFAKWSAISSFALGMAGQKA
jgi:hypothetical protein